MKTIIAIVALLSVASLAPLQAKDHYHGHKHSHHHSKHYHSKHYHSKHHHGHHYHGNYGHSHHHHHGPVYGSYYRCNGGFMVWVPGFGYVFRTHHHCH